MKQLTIFLSFFISFNFFSVVSHGQNDTIVTFSASAVGVYGLAVDKIGNVYYSGINSIVKIDTAGVATVIAGTGLAGHSGDGGPATAATLNSPQGIIFDSVGNIYFADKQNFTIRKIDSSGIITTIAGYPVLVNFAGDGGPATAAGLRNVFDITFDAAGNIYMTDNISCIRKISTAGIVSTIAGIDTLALAGTLGCCFSGDGGLAVNCQLNTPEGIIIDPAGNIYIADAGNNRIRKIDAAGIITTFAGTGTAGYSGDGGLALSAELNHPQYIRFDHFGNIFLTDAGNNVVRKISTSGIITTVAGNGIAGYSGDGGPATTAEFNDPFCIAFDAHNHFYVADHGNDVIRKTGYVPRNSSDSFSVFVDGLCAGIQLNTITTDAAATGVFTSFGDGIKQTDALTGVSGSQYTNVVHSYDVPGTYTVKESLLDGTVAVDSAHFSYQYMLCNSFSINFYYDANGNCGRDSGEAFFNLPFTTEIDSNGIAIDTVSTTSGFYYTAYGNEGDVYSFKILSTPAGIVPTCSGGTIVTDTLVTSSYNMKSNYMGFACTAASSFDLGLNADLISGRHAAIGNIVVYNNYCTPENATVTMNISPKYIFQSSFPAPASVVGNTVTWNMNDLSVYSPTQHIQFTLSIPDPLATSTWLTPGDTVQMSYTVTPSTGDIYAENNYCGTYDTVKSSFDPNEMAVSPSGFIAPGTQLQYTIQFENTGNDTAFNISVYDTLSDNVDVSSLRIVASSAEMNVAMLNYNGHTIAKFDFPNINLLDSSHHNLCNGMVIFNINAKNGLPGGTTIFNHAGIFFDDNPVVMTDTVENIIHISTSVAAVDNVSSLHIYPNPTTGVLNVNGILQNTAYRLLDVTGICIQQGTLEPGSNAVSMKNFAPGIYILEVEGPHGLRNKVKVVKE